MVVFAGTAATNACVSTVDFSEGRYHSEDTTPTVQVFYDKQGDMYPAALIPSRERLTDNFDHSLSCWYNFQLCNASNSAIQSDPEAKKHYEIWQEKQRDEITRVVNEVADKLNGSQSRKIVILIHGYRVSEAQISYSNAKEVLLEGRSMAESPVFIEVHWDGRNSPRLPLSALRAWPFAQKTAPLVGFRMRPLLNELNSRLNRDGAKAELYVLTHSTGAVVAGALFGNPSQALPCLESEKAANKCGPAYTEFFDFEQSGSDTNYVPHWPNMSLVMLAAATPAATFAVSHQPDLGFLGSHDSNLMLSMSARDSALNKYIGVPRFLGYSGLGVSRTELKILEDTLEGAKPIRANVKILDMTEELGREHGFTHYMNSSEFSHALDLLWDR